jgi:Amt family ammonium transporter
MNSLVLGRNFALLLLLMAGFCFAPVPSARAQEEEEPATTEEAVEETAEETIKEAAPTEGEAPAEGEEASPTTPTESTAVATPAFLQGTYDTGSTAWLMVSAALVFFMMPGLALFYGGMVRSKNLLNMFMCVMVCIPIVCIEWIGWGYSMAFAVPSAISAKSGDLTLSYLGWDPGLVFLKSFSQVDPVDGPNSFGKIVTSGDTTGAVATGVPELIFAMFQMMFAIITPALIVGALAERLKFSSWCISSCSGRRSSITLSRTGCGMSTAGSSRRACSTSPAAPWCTCSRAFRLSR